jgi:hypothetical protein
MAALISDLRVALLGAVAAFALAGMGAIWWPSRRAA